MGGALYRAGPNRRGESLRDDVENIILRSEMKILRRKSALSHADYFSPMPWRRIAFDERDLLRMQRRLGAPPGSISTMSPDLIDVWFGDAPGPPGEPAMAGAATEERSPTGMGVNDSKESV